MRKTAHTLYCDGNGCREYTEVAQLTDQPEGWYTIVQLQPHEGGPDGQRTAKFDFHSLLCVEKWAKGRRRELGEFQRGGRKASTPD